ncbi:unnamed protein product [Trichogramma brassicae]|uniref:C2H2-type domain-containing protein n=1 Tax=Trichogramma brassicae TaxID=86971 RepID=A0A6H5I7I8_9HYME|nr:unnamed protein product [Trichogramma brassicae]
MVSHAGSSAIRADIQSPRIQRTGSSSSSSLVCLVPCFHSLTSTCIGARGRSTDELNFRGRGKKHESMKRIRAIGDGVVKKYAADVARRERNTGSVYTADNGNSHWLWERDARLFQASAGSALRQYVSRLRGHLRGLDFGQQPGELRHDQAHLLPQASQGGDLRFSGEHLAGQLVTRHVCFAAHAGSHIDEEFYIRTVYVLLPAYVTGHTDTRDHDDVRAHRRRQISILNRSAQGQNSGVRLRHGLLVLRHLLGAAVPGLHVLLRRRGIATSSWASAVLRQFNGRYQGVHEKFIHWNTLDRWQRRQSAALRGIVLDARRRRSTPSAAPIASQQLVVQRGRHRGQCLVRPIVPCRSEDRCRWHLQQHQHHHHDQLLVHSSRRGRRRCRTTADAAAAAAALTELINMKPSNRSEIFQDYHQSAISCFYHRRRTESGRTTCSAARSSTPRSASSGPASPRRPTRSTARRPISRSARAWAIRCSRTRCTPTSPAPWPIAIPAWAPLRIVYDCACSTNCSIRFKNNKNSRDVHDSSSVPTKNSRVPKLRTISRAGATPVNFYAAKGQFSTFHSHLSMINVARSDKNSTNRHRSFHKKILPRIRRSDQESSSHCHSVCRRTCTRASGLSSRADQLSSSTLLVRSAAAQSKQYIGWRDCGGERKIFKDRRYEAFTQESSMTAHRDTIHNEKNDYTCDKCEKKFEFRSHLSRHQISVHKDRQNFSCTKANEKLAPLARQSLTKRRQASRAHRNSSRWEGPTECKYFHIVTETDEIAARTHTHTHSLDSIAEARSYNGRAIEKEKNRVPVARLLKMSKAGAKKKGGKNAAYPKADRVYITMCQQLKDDPTVVGHDLLGNFKALDELDINWILTKACEDNQLKILKFVQFRRRKRKLELPEFCKTALHIAARLEQVDYFELLLEIYDTSVNHKDPVSGFSHFQAACKIGHSNLAYKLLDGGIHEDMNRVAFVLTGARPDPRLLDIVLASGVPADLADETGATLLGSFCRQIASSGIVTTEDAKQVCRGVFRVLVGHGANVNSPDPAINVSPIQALYFSGIRVADLQLDVLKILLDYGADVHHRDDFGETIVHYVLRREYSLEVYGKEFNVPRRDPDVSDVLWLLVDDFKAEVNVENNAGQTPLSVAVSTCNREAVETLLELGADPNTVTFEHSYLEPNNEHLRNLEATQNLLDIVELLRAKDFQLEAQHEARVLRFLLGFPTTHDYFTMHYIVSLAPNVSFIKSHCRPSLQVEHELGPVYGVIINHMRILELGDMYVGERARESLDGFVDELHAQYEDKSTTGSSMDKLIKQSRRVHSDLCRLAEPFFEEELGRARKHMIKEKVSLIDVCACSPTEAYKLLEDSDWQSIVFSETFLRDYVYFGPVIKGYVTRALAKKFFDEASDKTASIVLEDKYF